jgi:endogenous inhibitor of DNA gyrase (YacG/DUF329 family)
MSESDITTFCPECGEPVRVPAYRPSDGPARPVHIATGKEDC